MKRSELKEAIKAEIKSVLTEEIQVGDIVTLGGDGDELEVIDSRRMFGSDMMAYRVKKLDGTKFNANVDFPEIGDETVEYSADQLRPARMMNEVYQTRSKMEQIVSLFQDMMDDEYDGQDYRKVLNMVLKAIDDDYKAAEREGEKFSRIREEDEPTDAEIKKADSVASAANKLQKLVKKMKDKAKDFKAAEGKAKEKIKDELKAMTAEKKKLEKAL
jgi:vacuolar-type H+-ATPase subunit I/STV1